MTWTVSRLYRFALVALSAGLVAGLAPGAGAQQPGSRQSGTQPASKVTIAIKAYENNLTPFTVTMAGLPTTPDLVGLVYDNLFWSPVKEDPEPWLAERADPSPDRRQWTVKLRPGVKWQDGQPLTSEDVAFTFEAMKKATGNRYSHHVWESPVFQSADILDPLTVRLNFQDPAPTFKILPGADLPIVPKHIWQNIPDPSKATTMLPIGTGPFKMVSFTPDQSYQFEANPDYFKGRPKVDRIDMPIVKDSSAAFAALQTGQIDSTDRSVPPELMDTLSQQPGMQVVKSTRMETIQLHFNTRKGALADPKVRKGITMSIDTNALVQTVLLGRGQPGRDGWIGPDSPWADPQGGHEFDVAKANRSLDDAGYRRGDDGIRRGPDGNPLTFALTVAANEPQQLRSAQLVSQQVQAVGVRMNVESIDPATLRQRRGAGNYDSFITNLESHAQVDPDALFFFFRSPVPNSPSASSFGAYSNPQFDQILNRARVTVDVDERKRLLNEAQRIFAQDAPAQVLVYPQGDYAYRTAAYTGWIADPGQGILTKRSFIPGYESAAARQATAGGGSSGPPWAVIGVVAALLLIGGAVLAARGRRRAESESDADADAESAPGARAGAAPGTSGPAAGTKAGEP